MIFHTLIIPNPRGSSPRPIGRHQPNNRPAGRIKQNLRSVRSIRNTTSAAFCSRVSSGIAIIDYSFRVVFVKRQRKQRARRNCRALIVLKFGKRKDAITRPRHSHEIENSRGTLEGAAAIRFTCCQISI